MSGRGSSSLQYHTSLVAFPSPPGTELHPPACSPDPHSGVPASPAARSYGSFMATELFLSWPPEHNGFCFSVSEKSQIPLIPAQHRYPLCQSYVALSDSCVSTSLHRPERTILSDKAFPHFLPWLPPCFNHFLSSQLQSSTDSQREAHAISLVPTGKTTDKHQSQGPGHFQILSGTV